MAEILDQITDGTEIVGRFETAIGNLSAVIEKLVGGVSGLSGGVLPELNSGILKTSDSMRAVKNSTNETGIATDYLSRKIGELTKGIFETVKAHKDLIGVGTAAAASIRMLQTGTTDAGISLREYNKGFEEVSRSGTKFAATVGTVLSNFGSMGDMAGGVYKNFVNLINETKSFESAILSAGQTGGNFFGTFGEGSTDMVSNMTSTMNKISERAYEVSNSLGLNFEDGIKRTIEVMKSMPGEFDKVYDGMLVDTQEFSLNTEQIISMVSRGVGISFSEGLGIARDMLYRFGEDAVEGATRVALISNASKELGFQFDDVKRLADDMDNSFSMWGNQMDGVIDILGDVSKALDGTNVGLEGQIRIVKDLGNAVQQMQLPMRSFIGVMSGIRGPGGAVGAGLEVEKMLQEGRMDEVVGMLQETMQKTTGRRAMTLQEATEDPRAQQAFLVQRQLLSTMTGITATPELNRLLEVMSQSQLGAEGLSRAQDVLSDAMTNGNDIATRQTDVMATLSENMLALNNTMMAVNQHYEAYRGATGAMPVYGENLLNVPEIQTGLNEQADRAIKGIGFAQQDITKEDAMNRISRTFGDLSTNLLRGAVQQGEVFVNSVKGFGDIITNNADPAVREFSKAISEATSPITNFVSNITEAIGGQINNELLGVPTVGPRLPTAEQMMPREGMRQEANPQFAIPRVEPSSYNIEFEPMRMQIDLNIKDNGEDVASKSYEMSAATLRILRSKQSST